MFLSSNSSTATLSASELSASDTPLSSSDMESSVAWLSALSPLLLAAASTDEELKAGEASDVLGFDGVGGQCC